MGKKEILNLITSEQSFRVAYYKVLQFCDTIIPDDELIEKIRSFPELKTAVVSARFLVKGLEEVGAIERVSDESGEKGWILTDIGRDVERREAPEQRIVDLFVREQNYTPVYLRILNFCCVPRKRQEIETELGDLPEFKARDLYPTYFVTNLESVGAVEWINNHWQTTPAGQKAI